MPSSHLILCRPLLLLPSIFPSIRSFPGSRSSHQHRGWPQHWRLQRPRLSVRVPRSRASACCGPASRWRRLPAQRRGESAAPRGPLLQRGLGRASFASCEPGTVKITLQGGREVKHRLSASHGSSGRWMLYHPCLSLSSFHSYSRLSAPASVLWVTQTLSPSPLQCSRVSYTVPHTHLYITGIKDVASLSPNLTQFLNRPKFPLVQMHFRMISHILKS